MKSWYQFMDNTKKNNFNDHTISLINFFFHLFQMLYFDTINFTRQKGWVGEITRSTCDRSVMRIPRGENFLHSMAKFYNKWSVSWSPVGSIDVAFHARAYQLVANTRVALWNAQLYLCEVVTFVILTLRGYTESAVRELNITVRFRVIEKVGTPQSMNQRCWWY